MTVIDATTFASTDGVDRFFEGSAQQFGDYHLSEFAVAPREQNPNHPFYTRLSKTKTFTISNTTFEQRFFYYRVLLGSYLKEFWKLV